LQRKYLANFCQRWLGYRENRMAKITIFTAPKPFTDPHVNVIQRNAIRSWLELGDDVDVLLLGDEDGMEEFAAELGVRQIKDIECSELGTPLVSSLFGTARENSTTDLLAYVNADIILLPDFVSSAVLMQQKSDKFLLVGQRWDLEITDEINFTSGWRDELKDKMKNSGNIHPPTGSDYFTYTRNVYKNTPEFTIGRAGWDNWFIYHAVTQPWIAADATESITVIHQNHDYSHLPDSKPHYTQPETFENIKIAGGRKNMYFLYDVNHVLVDGSINRKKLDLYRLIRKLEVIIHPPGVDLKGFRWKLTLWLAGFRRKLELRK